MIQLPLESIPAVMLDFMNEDHKEATLLTNKLYAAIQAIDAENSDARDTITELLASFYSHNKAHFAREEAEMERTGFPAYGCHKGEHERVLEELESVLQQWQQGMPPQALEHYLTATVAPWFINHINTMDTVTAMFVSRHTAAV